MVYNPMIEKKKIYGFINILQKAMKIAIENVEDIVSFRGIVPKILDIQQKVNKELFFTSSFSEKSFTPNNAEDATYAGYEFLKGVQNWFEYVVETLNGADEESNFIAPTEIVFFCIPKR